MLSNHGRLLKSVLMESKCRIHRRNLALFRDISIKKRLTIGIAGTVLVAVGSVYVGKRAFNPKKMEDTSASSELQQRRLVPPAVTEERPIEGEGTMIPWWNGIKEISVYLNKANSDIIDEHFSSSLSYKPRRKVILSYQPRPEDSNEYAKLMNDIITMHVIALVRDEHAEVLLLDLGEIPSIYRYPNLVLSCSDEDDASSYSTIYGRLLIDRAVKMGLLKEKGGSEYLPKEEYAEIEGAEYHNYPKNHITVTDLRTKGIVVQGRLCTSRSMDGVNDLCNEEKHDQECSWCVFMKSGPCCAPFTLWQKCAKQNKEGDTFIHACMELTEALQACVKANPDYYGVLPDEKNEDVAEVLMQNSEITSPTSTNPDISNEEANQKVVF